MLNQYILQFLADSNEVHTKIEKNMSFQNYAKYIIITSRLLLVSTLAHRPMRALNDQPFLRSRRINPSWLILLA